LRNLLKYIFLSVAYLLLFQTEIIFAQSDTVPQQKIKHDTLYFKTYDEYLIGRAYFSRKFTDMDITYKNDYDLSYVPNSTLNFGIGATYKFLTLNIGVGFSFLNPDEGQGKTRYLDLQFHSYGKKVILDVFGQFYNGFYLDPKGTAAAPDKYYVRPDMSLMELGGSIQYIFNNKRFSFRSSFTQNEWQRKSAGSFLAGVEMFYGDCRFDSTAIPTVINPETAAINYKRMNFFEGGINGGYGYTVVIKKHFFIHATLCVSLDYGTTSYYGDTITNESTGFGSNSILRTALGYNSDKWIANFLFTTTKVGFNTDDRYQDVAFNTGNFRLIVAKRFMPGKKLKRYLKLIDNIDF